MLSQSHEKNQKLTGQCLDIFTIANAMFDGIYITDTKGVVIAANKWYTHITGIEADEVIGRKIQDVLDEKYIKREYYMYLMDYLKEKRTKPKAYKIERNSDKPSSISNLVLEKKKEVYVLSTMEISGRNKKVMFVGIPISDNKGKVNYVLIVLREMTDVFDLDKKFEEIKKYNLYNQKKEISIIDSCPESSIIGDSPEMIKIRQLIKYVSKTDATVLITGETGTGKEVVANEIFENSYRSNKPYIKVNCAAIPESLLESELFGYDKGAFTGALNKTKPGYFELANGGTILLDEIGEMPIHLQSKILRILQEREFRRLGGTKSIRLDLRVIAATNRNLKEKIAAGEFREDLYYRLNVIPIEIPPLRERKEDIPMLVNKLLKTANEKYLKNKKITNEMIHEFENYDWPGNIRELINVIERTVIMGENQHSGNKQRDNWDEESSEEIVIRIEKNLDYPLKEITENVEREVIKNALIKYGSSHKAAKALGVSQPTILRKAKILGITKY
ncbi:sigma-54 interaction domain-containing protein [Alkalibacter mobilis]|uniref:sigma-54 interaction domain-containing protein n=1 Tax=Alkalibacter mobilis TaxID=2787712 RepID=UPI0018A05F5B|nr:sigma 54-interacting transcriptional regulator [Alkalibacter mobilis]MBF7097710.1 sigma 54-interacting transcriptional regulator [Alkalibacter mobilis]